MPPRTGCCEYGCATSRSNDPNSLGPERRGCTRHTRQVLGQVLHRNGAFSHTLQKKFVLSFLVLQIKFRKPGSSHQNCPGAGQGVQWDIQWQQGMEGSPRYSRTVSMGLIPQTPTQGMTALLMTVPQQQALMGLGRQIKLILVTASQKLRMLP